MKAFYIEYNLVHIIFPSIMIIWITWILNILHARKYPKEIWEGVHMTSGLWLYCEQIAEPL
jgi:hypothetical protein